MIIPLPPRSLQPPHLLILQPPPHNILQLLPANLLPRPRLFVRFQPGFEARLHANAESRVEGDRFCVAADFRGFVVIGVFGDGEEFLALGLDGKCAGGVGGGDAEEGFLGGDGFACGGEDAKFVAA